MKKYLLIILFGLMVFSCQKKHVDQLNSQQSAVEKIFQNEKRPAKSKAKEKTDTDKVENKIHHSKAVLNYCQKIDEKFKKYRWGKSQCTDYKWHHVRDSFLGDPLIWVTFGNEFEHKNLTKKNMTLILCAVHGDEITPVKFCFDLLDSLRSLDNDWSDELVVIAPIVNPDGFFRKRPTRTNYRGVDVNRNFPTKDWQNDALRLWKHRYRKDPRRYPGEKPLSEHETLFQVNLIKRYNPSKIISVHSPLTILDYDGPELGHSGLYLANNANKLLSKMSDSAKGYRVKNYPFFPGSLGNYAGNERHIPTYTLELPSSDWTKHKRFWSQFKESLHLAIFEDLSMKTALKNN